MLSWILPRFVLSWVPNWWNPSCTPLLRRHLKNITPPICRSVEAESAGTTHAHNVLHKRWRVGVRASIYVVELGILARFGKIGVWKHDGGRRESNDTFVSGVWGVRATPPQRIWLVCPVSNHCQNFNPSFFLLCKILCVFWFWFCFNGSYGYLFHDAGTIEILHLNVLPLL